MLSLGLCARRPLTFTCPAMMARLAFSRLSQSPCSTSAISRRVMIFSSSRLPEYGLREHSTQTQPGQENLNSPLKWEDSEEHARCRNPDFAGSGQPNAILAHRSGDSRE